MENQEAKDTHAKDDGVMLEAVKDTHEKDEEVIVEAKVVNTGDKKNKEQAKGSQGDHSDTKTEVEKEPEWKDIAGSVAEKGKESLKEGAEKSGEALKTVSKKLGKFFQVSAEKMGELTSHTVEVTKNKFEEHRLNSELSKQFQSLGEKLWRLHQAQKLNEVDESLSEDFEKIAEIESALEEDKVNKE